jgi:surface protein
MPNAIKYNVSAETLSLKKGNFWIGTGDVGKGPTSSTGYYNGITPPSGGYTIYLNKETGGPSIYTVDNDVQLISLTNSIAGQSYTSATQCLVYYAGQTDKVCFNRDYEPIITDGLVLNLDAGFDGSYPASGTTWGDLSVSGNNGTLINSPGFYDNGGGSIVFDGTDDYISTNNGSSLTQAGNTQFTAGFWIKKTASDKDAMIGPWDNSSRKGWFLQWFTDNVVYFGITNGGTNYNYVSNGYTNNWNNIVGVFDGSQSTNQNIGKIYVNGVLQTTNNSDTMLTSVPTNLVELTIGKLTNYNSLTTGNISQVQVYNRALTSSEVLQNYNAMKDRFAFIFTVDTTKVGTTSSTQFKLPLVSSGSINFVVEWGDGTTDTITTFNQAQTTHTYSSGGTYEIKIRGLLKGWQFNNGGDKFKMGVIKNWGCLDISVGSGFYGCGNMTCVASDAPVITTTSLLNYFRTCTNFNGAIGNWDVSNVTSLNFMFYLASSFASPLNNWNVSKVQDFGGLFVGTAYNSPLNNWDTSSATYMGEMFNISSFNQDISNWNVSKNTSMYYMFRGSSFNQDISNWDVSKVTNMHFAFAQSSFNKNIGGWNVSGVTDMSYMFFNNRVFNQNIGSWNTSAVTNMLSMFNQATVFNQNIGAWNTEKVTNMVSMFESATAFNQNIGSWNVSGVTNMSQMFFFATAFNQDIGEWNVSNVTNMSLMFTSAIAFNQDIGEWNVSNVTNMVSMFQQATNFNANIGSWNVSNVTNMNLMFSEVTNFNQNIASWNVSNVTTMNFMFNAAAAFNQNIGSWNVSNVTTMFFMFNGATAFNQDIGSWNVSNVTNFGSFMEGKAAANYSAANLNSIYNGWGSRAVQPNLSISFGSIKYNSTAQSSKNILTGSPNNWTITDGGQV